MIEDRRRYHPVDASDRQWHALLSFALERADGFQCALPYPFVTQNLASLPLWPKGLDRFRADVLDRHVSLLRWERRQDYPTQTVVFRLTPALAGWVATLRCLEYWQWRHGAPEDPTFLHHGAVLLATESRDGRIAVYADELDVAHLAGAGVRLLEPLGVRAEPWPTP